MQVLLIFVVLGRGVEGVSCGVDYVSHVLVNDGKCNLKAVREHKAWRRGVNFGPRVERHAGVSDHRLTLRCRLVVYTNLPLLKSAQTPSRQPALCILMGRQTEPLPTQGQVLRSPQSVVW